MKKRILLIATGGTIASEMTQDGLLPGLGAEELLRYVPDVAGMCDIGCLQLYDLDSTNIGPRHWLGLAEAIRMRYMDWDGFVVSHGTDTMAYTAAALSYLIQGSRKPIIFTGAQKPISFDSTDSKVNLKDAFLCASAESIHGVNIVFNGRVITGTRASKTRSKSFDAFSSINYPNIADVRDGRLLQYIVPSYLEEPLFFESLNAKVGLLKLTPGLDTELFRFQLERNDALIVESFGVGGLPQGGGLHQMAETAAKSGKTIVMTTQVPNEGSDLAVYNTGHSLKMNPRILEGYDMTTEAVLAKTMWILGQTSDPQRIRELFYTPVARDMISAG